MFLKENVLAKIKQVGLVAVVRAESPEQARSIAEACIAGGVAAIEITFTVPNAVDVIKDLTNQFSPEKIIIGAGTVLDPETARAAILAGTQFIVSPCLSKNTAELCNRYQIPYIPGAMTIKEVVECMETGADIIKIFPGELFGPAIIKAIKGPIPFCSLMPTGGVSLDNVGEWIKAGSVAIGVGGSLTQGAKNGDYTSITNIAKKFIKKIQEARG